MECPDKLEPDIYAMANPKVGNHTGSNPQYLTSVLKNVPVELMWHLREYHSKPSHFEIKWRARQPVEGKKYGYGGDLKWEDARSGDMYVRDRSLEQKYQHLQDVNRNLTKNLVEATESFSNLQVGHRLLQTKHDDLLADHMDGEEWKARHDDLLHQLQDEKMCLTHVDKVMVDVERGKAQEWTDDMSEQADKDYDAVTKGVISLINLLRR